MRVLAYNMKCMIRIFGVQPLIQCGPDQYIPLRCQSVLTQRFDAASVGCCDDDAYRK